ncbi:MAG: excinuclease ABC subunit UvrA, partial [Polyangiaceae bacterium]|nr:excinuclease ABC subunit UvrA [Polyangiaceae bacterium]
YAEGQRRFVESFSPYARQFLERLERPPMDSLEPVGAGVAVDRSAPIKSSRSTVATMADLEPYLAGLFAKEAIPHCPEHHVPAQEVTLDKACAEAQQAFADKTTLVAWRAEVGNEEAYLELHEKLVTSGYRRLLCGGEVLSVDELQPSKAVREGAVFIILDRIRVRTSAQSRLKEAIEAAFSASRGARTAGQVWFFAGDQELHLREGLSCPTCARPLQPPRPGYFSYESPLGACGNCRGFGRVMGIDLDKVIPDERVSLADGALRPWRGPQAAWERKQLMAFCRAQKIPTDQPWEALTKSQQRQVLEGTGKRGRANYWGVYEWFQWLESKAYKMHVRVFLARYRSYDPCPVCHGARLNEHALSYQLGGASLADWHQLEIHEAVKRLRSLKLTSPHGKLLCQELTHRLDYLEKVGLGYLCLDRQARTLSGGEAQRVTLTAALGTSLHHALFVIDEPSVGLHASDIAPLNQLIRELAQRGNAVLVIEHEPQLIAGADRVVELGPASGARGGEIVFDGTVAAARKAKTATSRALKGPKVQATPRSLEKSQRIKIRGASSHNLQGVDVDLPLEGFVVVSGPSGSGKSSLAVDILYRSIARHLGVADVPRPGAVQEVSGLEALKSVELVDQSPLGRTSRGNPATYTKVWDSIRKAFAAEPAAEAKGMGPSHFSFNVPGGRCEACAGEGYETVEMQFLADVSLVCPVCSGKRFKAETLEVEHRGLNIHDVLELSVDQALEVFHDLRPVRRGLLPLQTLGLGYLRLGQPLSTLSGGEAQRLKLARALAKPRPGTFYLMDEPSAGLHADEVELLLQAIDTL